jgi:membrane associated rhomboid family serine protease
MSQHGEFATGGLPRPGKVVKVALLVVFGVWVVFAVGLNWAGAPPDTFLLFCGNTSRILHGEVWRLITAPVVHMPTGEIGHVLSALFGLYFLSPQLETAWGSGRFARFLGFSALIAYGTQMCAELLLPHAVGAKLVGEYWFGAMPVVEAIAIAWALSFRGQVIRLFMLIPVTSRGLIIFVVGVSVMYLLASARPPEGLIAPFGGMLAGYLLGGGTPSPVRRLWLKLRVNQLDAEARREAARRRRRVEGSRLKVIEGGGTGDEPAKGRSGDADDDRGPDGRWLN